MIISQKEDAMIIVWICAAITLLGLTAYALQIFSVRAVTRAGAGGRTGDDAIPLPPVSILKPLKGLDDNLFDNLASFCTQDYPEYEVLFSLQDRNDPAYKVAKMVRDRHPDRNI